MDLSFLKKFGIDKPWVLYTILAIVVALIIMYFAYSSRTSPTSIENFTDNKEKTAELMFFYVDWCPHCKTAKPVWESLKSTYETAKIKDRRIIFTEVNCTNETKEIEALMDKYKIEGYPTFKLIKDNQVYDFDAKPSEESLVSFMNQFL